VRKIVEAVEVTGQPSYPAVADTMQHFILLTFDEPVKNIEGVLRVSRGHNIAPASLTAKLIGATVTLELRGLELHESRSRR